MQTPGGPHHWVGGGGTGDREGVPWWQREEEPGARGCDGDCWRHHHTIGSLSTATSKTLILWALRNAHPRESAQLHPDDLWQ